MNSASSETLPAPRQKTRRITIGSVPIGDGAPIVVQSMTNTDTRDVRASLDQILALAAAGCELVRLAVPDSEAAEAFGRIRAASPVPLVADIHFDHRLAIAAIEAGADAIRINPGNIGTEEHLRQVVESARAHGIPIRVGVNAGSLPKAVLARYGRPCPEALVAACLAHVRLLESWDFHAIKLSLKSSDVRTTIAAYQQLSHEVDYPLHLGVTEAGTLISGTVKSALGIGYLLAQGIGDTLRVSLTRDPLEEVKAGYEILRALGIRARGPEIIACPTCGRTEIDLFGLVEKVERALYNVAEPVKVAIMGCVVNGPGEAREADIGVAGGRGQGILFKKGEIVRKVPEHLLAETLIAEVHQLIRSRK